MEINNEADKIKRKIIWKNVAIFLLSAIDLILFLKLMLELDTLEAKPKLYLEIAIPVIIVLCVVISYTQKKDRKAWEEAEKYFHPDKNAEQKPKTKIEMLREANTEKMKQSTSAGLGNSSENKDKDKDDNAETENNADDENDATRLIGSKAKVTSDGRVSGIGEYKFTSPNGKGGLGGPKKTGFNKFDTGTGVRSDSTLTGQTNSILDRFK